MKWNKYTIKTVSGAEDMISATLAELGIQGVEIEDRQPLTEEEKQQMFVDILPELPADDGTARVSFYLEPEEDNPGILARVREELENLRNFTDIGEGTILSSETEDADWINNWKQYFKPIPVGEKLVIRPTWETYRGEAGENRVVLDLDPGLAFGTGTHETTRLCLQLLEKAVKPGQALLDVGCGSGILSVASLLLGAGSAVGVDIDELAVKTARENAALNHVEDRFTAICGDLTQHVSGRFDIVAANIVADVILRLTKDIPTFLKPGGIYIMSGIIDTREDEVLAAIAPRFTVLERREEKGWIALAARLQ